METTVWSSSEADIHTKWNLSKISSWLTEQTSNHDMKVYQKHKRDHKFHGCLWVPTWVTWPRLSITFEPTVNRQPGYRRWDSSSQTFSKVIFRICLFKEFQCWKFQKKPYKNKPPVEILEPDKKQDCIIVGSSYSVKIKFDSQRSFPMAHFHMIIVLMKENSPKGSTLWIGSVDLERVSLMHQHYSSSFTQRCRAGRKPSTWFPLGTRRANHQIQNVFHSIFLLTEVFKSPESAQNMFERIFIWWRSTLVLNNGLIEHWN